MAAIRPATIDDVAGQAGVSVATVSRALRGLPNVAPSTREKVLRVAAELRYRPDPHASRLAAGRTHTIGLAVPHVTSWYYAQVIAGVEDVTSEWGYDLLVVTVDGSEARERFVELARSSARRVDGLIMVDLFFSPSQQAELAASGMVAVTVGVRTEFFDSFTIDNAAAAALATRHLINLGHRRLGIISGGETPGFDFTAEAGRRNGFLEALTDAGLPYLERQGGYSVVGGIEAMNTLLASTAPPTGVFAFSDEMAMGALKSLRDHGLAVPGDVSVIGFDGHELAELFGLTTIRQEVEEMAAAAVRRLLERLQSSADPERHEVFPTKLIVRASTGPAPLDRA